MKSKLLTSFGSWLYLNTFFFPFDKFSFFLLPPHNSFSLSLFISPTPGWLPQMALHDKKKFSSIFIQPQRWKKKFKQNEKNHVKPKPRNSLKLCNFSMIFKMKFLHIFCASDELWKKGKGGKSNQVDEENVTLRIHRGNKNQRSDLTISSSSTNLDGLRKNHTSVTSMPSFERKRRRSSKFKDKVTISISYPSTEHIASPTMSTTSSNQASLISSSCSKEPISLRHSNSTDCHNLFKDSRNENSPQNSHKKAGKRTSSGVKFQVRKFRMETKAAKTLAIIVGKCLVC